MAVYHFDSDGEDSAGYSSTVSETSEQLDGHRRTSYGGQRGQRGQRRPAHVAAPPPPAAASHDAAATWAAARGRSTAADRAAASSPRYAAAADGLSHVDRHHYSAADNAAAAPPARQRSNTSTAAGGRPALATISRTLHVADHDDDAERRTWNGSVSMLQTSKYDRPDSELHSQSQRHLAPADAEGWVPLSCGLVAVDNPLFIDRAHYEYMQVMMGPQFVTRRSATRP